MEQNPLDGGHYLAGVFNGTLVLNNTYIKSTQSSIFIIRITYNATVGSPGHVHACMHARLHTGHGRAGLQGLGVWFTQA